MRKEFLLLAIFLVGGTFVAYNSTGSSPFGFFSARGTVPRSTIGPPAPAESAPPQRPKARSVGAHSRHEPPANTFAPVAGESVIVPISPNAFRERGDCCGQKDFPFPTSETLRKGATQNEIRAIYGAPELDVARTDGGWVFEKFYYVNSTRDRLTIANIENGRLVSVENHGNAAFALPRAGSLQR